MDIDFFSQYNQFLQEIIQEALLNSNMLQVDQGFFKKVLGLRSAILVFRKYYIEIVDQLHRVEVDGQRRISFALKRLVFDFEEEIALNDNLYFAEQSFPVMFPGIANSLEILEKLAEALKEQELRVSGNSDLK